MEDKLMSWWLIDWKFTVIDWPSVLVLMESDSILLVQSSIVWKESSCDHPELYIVTSWRRHYMWPIVANAVVGHAGSDNASKPKHHISYAINGNSIEW